MSDRQRVPHHGHVTLTVRFLRDKDHGGDPAQPAAIAGALADFLTAATTSLDISIYDFRLYLAANADPVVSALKGAASRGVTVRIGYDAGSTSAALPRDFVALEADPAPAGTAEWLTETFSGTSVQVRAIDAGRYLMHDKYVVRDIDTVWTGSTNFTDDAWTLQENNVLTIADAAVATGYRTDFDQMWDASSITHTGTGAGGSSGTVTWGFSPADGPALGEALASRVDQASTRIVVGAMVLTSAALLTALAGALDRGVAVTGIFDGGQMDPIVTQWKSETDSYHQQLLANWTAVSQRLARKQSTPYTPTGPHDFMHLKVMVTDDTVTTGSFNFSANAQHNAENQLAVGDPDIVQEYVDFLGQLVDEYA